MKQELPACPVEITMGLIDDKWKILIIRDLLTNNLRDMEKSGLVHREVFAEVPPRVEYQLTELGVSILNPMREIVNWIEGNWTTIITSREVFDQKHPKEESELQ